ncbi:hypothetical protein [Streptomyces sp. SID3343]|uniref:hypothetical protein n=1 Tax=Streptomyces sp. SID3343 TaxID=2690260 RepID=UPI00136F24A9|nr:hypothetical protein [Streptomyces sp. SID3343]MYW03372.1 hypothetical protein [Streptomyces sp. SID3343]MYW06222.1 hypothetical protein [Streptomyces sp. SID3343]
MRLLPLGERAASTPSTRERPTTSGDDITPDNRGNENERHHQQPDFPALYNLANAIADRLQGWWQANASRLLVSGRRVLAETVWETTMLVRAVTEYPCPHAAVLIGPGVERLLVAPDPDNRERHIVGSLAPWGADPRHDWPHDPLAPPVVAIPDDPEQAAAIIKTRLLPPLHAALDRLDRIPQRRIDTGPTNLEPHVRVGRFPLFDMAVAHITETTPPHALDILRDHGFEDAGPGRLSLYGGNIPLARRTVRSLREAGVVVHADLARANSLAALALAMKTASHRRTAPPSSATRPRPPSAPTAPRRR